MDMMKFVSIGIRRLDWMGSCSRAAGRRPCQSRRGSILALINSVSEWIAQNKIFMFYVIWLTNAAAMAIISLYYEMIIYVHILILCGFPVKERRKDKKGG